MRWLTFLILWIAAIVLAILILRRVRRGKPVVLTGRWSPGLIRMVVVVLVVLGVGDEARMPEASAAPLRLPIRSTDDELPKALTPQTIQTWLIVHQENGPYARHETALARALMTGQPPPKNVGAAAGPFGAGPGGEGMGLPVALQKLIDADLAALRANKPLPNTTAGDVRVALDDLEKVGRYDHFWNAYLWRKTADFADPADRVELFARFRRHARVTDALIRAHAQVKPLMTAPRAWANKGGGGPFVNTYQPHPNAGADLLKAAAEVLPTTDEGTWKRDGVVLFRPVAGSPAPAVVRGGTEWTMPADDSTRFGRLDLFKTGDKPAAIAHDWLGKVELPANQVVSVWDLPSLLSDAAKQKLDETVHEALKTNSEAAADRLERCLAVSHFAIRAGLKELPKAKGAPRLRLILALFDDTVMPGLPNYRVGPADGFGSGFGGRP